MPDELAGLVDAARGGDRSAFEALVRATSADTYTLAFRLTGNDEDARDVVQETYLRAYKGIGKFRGDAQFSTWLYRVTANAALMRMRSERRRRATSLEDANPEQDGMPLVPAGGEWAERADKRMENHQLNLRLEKALAELPHGYREVVIEHYIEGRPLQGVADNLGTTESAVRSRLHRARASLRRMLADLGAPVREGDLATDELVA